MEKNSRVNLFFSFGRSVSFSLSLSITLEELEVVIQSRLSSQPVLRVQVCESRGTAKPFTPIDKHSADSSKRCGVARSFISFYYRASNTLLDSDLPKCADNSGDVVDSLACRKIQLGWRQLLMF